MDEYKGTIAVLSCHTPSLFWFRIEMIKSFQEKGWRVYAVGNESEDGWKARFDDAGISYRQIRVKRNGTNPINDLETVMSIIDLMKEIRPDKLFTYQAKTVIYGGVAAGILGIKEVYPLIAGVGSVFLANDLKSKILKRLLVMEYKLAFRNAKCIFFQNADDLATFRHFKMVTSKTSVVMVPGSGVNTDRYKPLPFPDVFGFLWIGRLIRDKGIYEYLEACRMVKKKLPQIRCMLVGPYDTNPSSLQPEELRPFISEGIIEYYGEQTDIRPFMEQCSVYVLPSYREGIPKTVLEAMACGRAVITSDAPGCRETVEEGKNGYLVPIKNTRALADKMIQMYDDQALIERMGVYGRKMAERVFDVSIVNRIICETMSV